MNLLAPSNQLENTKDGLFSFTEKISLGAPNLLGQLRVPLFLLPSSLSWKKGDELLHRDLMAPSRYSSKDQDGAY